MRVVSRPGLERYAGPTTRQLVVARWLPVFVPLLLYGMYRAGIHYSGIFFLLIAAVLLMSARAWLATGAGLGILMFLQFLSATLATLLLAANFFSPESWLFYSAATILMMSYVSFAFNLLGSYLPR